VVVGAHGDQRLLLLLVDRQEVLAGFEHARQQAGIAGRAKAVTGCDSTKLTACWMVLASVKGSYHVL
jgi:hypothetical protein